MSMSWWLNRAKKRPRLALRSAEGPELLAGQVDAEVGGLDLTIENGDWK